MDLTINKVQYLRFKVSANFTSTFHMENKYSHFLICAIFFFEIAAALRNEEWCASVFSILFEGSAFDSQKSDQYLK